MAIIRSPRRSTLLFISLISFWLALSTSPAYAVALAHGRCESLFVAITPAKSQANTKQSLMTPSKPESHSAKPNAAGLPSDIPTSKSSKYEKLAEELGLHYLKAPVPQGYTRTLINSRTYYKKDGTPGKTVHYYRYFRPDGTIIRPRVDQAEFQEVVSRFQSAKLDPKWNHVWLSPDEETHIQILAKNNRGETIAIYHPDWGSGSSQAKYKRVQTFGNLVPKIRQQLEKILQEPTLEISSKEKVEATALLLLASGRIRVGDNKYLQRNGTTGVTTLRKDQVLTDAEGRLFLKYIGKSGNKDPENPTTTTLEIADPVLKSQLLALREANPEDSRLMIFKTRSDVTALTPSYLNKKLQELTSSVQNSSVLTSQAAQPSKVSFTVKDFRTWSATVKTVEELIHAGPPPTSLNRRDYILSVIAKKVSLLLNNTPGVARTNYIDPRLLNPEAYEQIWNFCQQNFPALIEAGEISTPASSEAYTLSEYHIQYDAAFEPLALAYLQSLEKNL